MCLIVFLCVPVKSSMSKAGFPEKFTTWGNLSFAHNFVLPWLAKSIS